MEKDQAAFAAEVAAIADELDLPASSGAILDVARAINDRVQTANAAQASRAGKQQSLESARERQRALAETLAILTKRKAEMTAFFGVGSLAEVGAKLQSVERKAELEEQAASAARDILNALGLATIDAAERALDSADRAALEAEFAELKARFDDQDQRSRDLFSATARPSIGSRPSEVTMPWQGSRSTDEQRSSRSKRGRFVA